MSNGNYQFCGNCKFYDKKKHQCPKGIFDDSGKKVGAVCEKDGFLNNLYEVDLTDTLDHDEVLEMYKDMVKDFKGITVRGEDHKWDKRSDAYAWRFKLCYKGKNIYHLSDCEYKKLPPSRKNVESKVKRLKNVLKKQYKDIYVKEMIESVAWKLRELDKDNKHGIRGFYYDIHDAGINSDVDILAYKVNKIYDIKRDGIFDDADKLMEHCLKNKIFKNMEK